MNRIYFKLLEAAGGFSSSTIATGTANLLTDILNWLYVIVPITGALFIAYFAIRRSGAEPNEKSDWTKRITTAVVSTLIGVLASVIINLIVGYYVAA